MFNKSVPNVGSSEKTKDAPWIVSLQLEEDDRAYCGATMIKSIQVGSESTVHPQNHLTESFFETQTGRTTYTAHCSGWILTAASCTPENSFNNFCNFGVIIYFSAC